MGRPDRTRRALLDAAVTVLTKDSSASLAEVASVAGVGRTTLHRYYPTREGLIRALVEDALDRVAEAIASAHPEDGPVLEALQRVTDTVVPLGPSLAFLHAEPDQYNARDLIRRWYDALEPVAGAVERGQADGSIRRDLPVEVDRRRVLRPHPHRVGRRGRGTHLAARRTAPRHDDAARRHRQSDDDPGTDES